MKLSVRTALLGVATVSAAMLGGLATAGSAEAVSTIHREVTCSFTSGSPDTARVSADFRLGGTAPQSYSLQNYGWYNADSRVANKVVAQLYRGSTAGSSDTVYPYTRSGWDYFGNPSYASNEWVKVTMYLAGGAVCHGNVFP